MAPLPRDRTCTARVCLERELLRTRKVDAAHRQRVRPKHVALRSGGRCPSFGSARSCVRGESTAWYVPHQGVRGEELKGARRRRQGTLGPGQQVGKRLGGVRCHGKGRHRRHAPPYRDPARLFMRLRGSSGYPQANRLVIVLQQAATRDNFHQAPLHLATASRLVRTRSDTHLIVEHGADVDTDKEVV